ncbi:unnamed protein product [marine sediment metagenome]|uniref:Uncharacterized protein n=1 Tax=marine sediment metagenome TaxID=412755 RepID=X1JDI9_9ZZZZ
MSKNLDFKKLNKELEEFRGFNQKEWDELNPGLRTLIGLRTHITGKGSALFKCIIQALTDNEKRLKKIEAELGIYTEKEIKNIKVGLTDPD